VRRAGSDEWVFSSPIGNEVARIESSAGGARLTRAGAGSEEAASFEALTERVLGIALDPGQLSAWLHGGVDRADCRPSGR
jgi:outer membrane biogenesis lipoprotein LolB